MGKRFIHRVEHGTIYFTHLVCFKGSLPRTTLTIFSIVGTSNNKFVYVFPNCHIWVILRLVRKENIQYITIVIHVRVYFTIQTDSYLIYMYIPWPQVLLIIRQDSCKAALTLEQNDTVTQSRTACSLSNEFVTTLAQTTAVFRLHSFPKNKTTIRTRERFQPITNHVHGYKLKSRHGLFRYVLPRVLVNKKEPDQIRETLLVLSTKSADLTLPRPLQGCYTIKVHEWKVHCPQACTSFDQILHDL